MNDKYWEDQWLISELEKERRLLKDNVIRLRDQRRGTPGIRKEDLRF